MLNTFIHNDCCSVGLATALHDGALDRVDSWYCETCGTQWRAEVYRLEAGAVDGRHWQPIEPALVFRL